MRERLIATGKVVRIDDGVSLFIDGHVHRKLATEEIELIVSDISNDRVEKLISWAAEKVGMPYSQALRDSGTHFDCSSFVYYAYQHIGVNISFNGEYTAHQIAKGLEIKGKTFTNLSNLRPGDLIFSSNRSNESKSRYKGITHVVLYVGDGMIIDAQSTQAGITYRKLPNYSSSALVYAARPL